MKPLIIVVILTFFCIFGHLETASSALEYTSESLALYLKQNDVTIINQPGFFKAMLEKCDREGVWGIPWDWVHTHGTTLVNKEDREALGKLTSHMKAAEGPNLLLYGTDTPGKTITDVINYIPNMKSINSISILPYRRNPRYGLLKVSLLLGIPSWWEKVARAEVSFRAEQFTSTISKFADALRYNGVIEKLNIWGFHEKLFPDMSVLKRLYRMNVKSVYLDTRARPSVVFPAGIMSGVKVTWEKLVVDKRVLATRKDRQAIDGLRRNDVISGSCNVMHYPNSKLVWLKDKQEYDWSRI